MQCSFNNSSIVLQEKYSLRSLKVIAIFCTLVTSSPLVHVSKRLLRFSNQTSGFRILLDKRDWHTLRYSIESLFLKPSDDSNLNSFPFLSQTRVKHYTFTSDLSNSSPSNSRTNFRFPLILRPDFLSIEGNSARMLRFLWRFEILGFHCRRFCLH